MFISEKNLNQEFFTIRNLSSEIKGAIYFVLKFSNSIMNHSNNKANHWCIEKLQHMSGMCHHPKFDFAILQKDIPNSPNNNLSKKPLQFLFVDPKLLSYLFWRFQ